MHGAIRSATPRPPLKSTQRSRQFFPVASLDASAGKMLRRSCHRGHHPSSLTPHWHSLVLIGPQNASAPGLPLSRRESGPNSTRCRLNSDRFPSFLPTTGCRTAPDAGWHRSSRLPFCRTSLPSHFTRGPFEAFNCFTTSGFTRSKNIPAVNLTDTSCAIQHKISVASVNGPLTMPVPVQTEQVARNVRSSDCLTRLRVIATNPKSLNCRTLEGARSDFNCIFQRQHHLVSILALIHVDEVDHNDPAQMRRRIGAQSPEWHRGSSSGWCLPAALFYQRICRC